MATALTDTQRYKLILAYRGTAYHGWQRQIRTVGDVATAPSADATTPPAPPAEVELPTIQNELRLALIRTLGHEIQVAGSSRTDAGVHALGQAAHFETIRTQIEPERILMALNAKLPDDIAALAIAPVPQTFDAISSATEKSYRYVIHHGAMKDPFRADLALHIPRPLDLGAMRSAAEHLVGEHDFASFAKPGHGRETTVRAVTSAAVETSGDDIHLEFAGAGFLWHQVRIMAGTLIEVGFGRRDPAAIPGVLASRDRAAAGPTAPAYGLYLVSVVFA